jgi:cystathionine beta-lyase/cystathionine gamma-synthase
VSNPSASRGPRRGEGTRAIHGDHPLKPGPLSTPIVHSSTFAFATLAAMMTEQGRHAEGAFYQRHGHPTLRGAEEKLAALEGAEDALLFSSGVAAIAAMFMSTMRAGDRIVSIAQTYGGTQELLNWGEERLGWKVARVDGRDPSTFESALRERSKIFHVESPTNPILCVVDVAAAAALAHAHGALLTIDNTVASPIGQHALELGADLVMYSATKSIGGHSDVLAGAVLGRRAALEPVWKVRKVFGPIPDPETAWRIERSLKTLPLRVEAANARALELATRLGGHPGVAQVFYPGLAGHPGHDIARRQMRHGFGPLLSFEVRGGAAAAEATANALRLVRHAPSLGSVESLVSLPAHTSHIQLGVEGRRAAGIPEGLVRLSVGIEDVDDLWADLDQAVAVGVALAV